MTSYELLAQQIQGFCESEPYYVPLFANTSALLWESLEDINWVGFYFLRDGQLVLGPFQGKPACIHIAPGRGVCGTAAAEGRIQRVGDVHWFPGHIPCDSASNAEIVLPIFHIGAVAAVLDIDSPLTHRFTPQDEEGLRRLAELLSAHAVFS